MIAIAAAIAAITKVIGEVKNATAAPKAVVAAVATVSAAIKPPMAAVSSALPAAARIVAPLKATKAAIRAPTATANIWNVVLCLLTKSLIASPAFFSSSPIAVATPSNIDFAISAITGATFFTTFLTASIIS